MKLKVLWLAAYPYDQVVEKTKSRPHPVPWVTSLADSIKDSVELTIVSYSWRINESVTIEKNGINFVFIKIPDPLTENLSLKLLKIRCFKGWLSKNINNFDVVHVNGTEYQFGSSIPKNTSVPVVYSIQGLISETFRFKPEKFTITYIGWRIGSFYEKRELRRFRNFICRTHWDSSIVLKYNKNAKIYKNWELMRTNFYSDLNDYNSFTLLYVGGINKIKGISETLLAYDKLHSLDKRYHLVICGYGNLKELDKLIIKLNLKVSLKDITFKGFVDDNELSDLFKNSFVLVHPTYIDNSPNSISEAQIAGLPVVAANVGGVSSLIENEKTGFLVERFEVDEIVNSIVKLKTDKEKYDLISSNSKSIARKRHDEKNIVSNLISIYYDIVNYAV